MATTKNVGSGSKIAKIGTVKDVVGTVTATDSSGVVRTLHAGDQVFANDVIQTSGDGVILIEFSNGSFADLGRNSSMTLDNTAFSPDAASAEKAEVAAIQAQIAAGADPTQITEAPAAGPVAADEGGSSFVVIDQLAPQGEVTSGFPTGPFSVAFQQPASELGIPVPVAEGNSPPVIEIQPPTYIPPGETPPPNTAPDGIVSPGQVFEEGLNGPPAGTNAGQNSETATLGSITISDPDGLNTIASLTIGNTTFTIGQNGINSLADIVGQTVQGEHGFLTVTGYNGNGTFTFSYTLTVATTEGVNDNDSFTVTVTDNGGASASATVTATIIDDVPFVLGSDSVLVEEESVPGLVGNNETDGLASSASGTIVDNAQWGADGFGSATSVTVGASTFTITSTTPATVYFDANGQVQDNSTNAAGVLTVNSDGSYTFAVLGAFHHATGDGENALDLPAMTITAVDGDGDPASVSLTLSVQDDVPVVTSGDTALVAEGSESAAANGTIVDNAQWGADGFGSATTVTVGGTDFTITSTTPATVYFDANGQVQDGSTNAAGVLTVNSDGSYTFSVLGAFHHAAGGGENNLALPATTITAVDSDGDPATVSLALSVQDDVPVVLGGDTVLVEEESVPGLAGNNETDGLSYTANGTIVDNAQWGADGFGSATSVTVGTSTFIITSGLPATVYFDANGDVQNGDTNAAGVLTVNSDGSYTFSVLGAFHHAAGNGENTLALPDATITAVDGDGDPVSVSLTLSVQDDVPVVTSGDTALVAEGAESVAANGNIVDNANWGADGFGSATSVTVGSTTVNITSGSPAIVYFDANGDVQNGDTNAAGVLTVNSDGSYTFSVLGAFHHAAGNGENTLALPDATITAVDGDGDPVSVSLTLSVQDDAPVVTSGDTALLAEGAESVAANGTIVDNANWGADGFGSATSVTVGSTTVNITSGSPATVYFDANGDVQNGDTNAAGVLTVNSDGSYTFTLLGAFHHATGDGENALALPNATITAVDGDGDPVSISLALSVQDDVPVVLGGDTVLVEEESVPGLAGNNETDGLSYTANGTIVDNAQWGADGFGSATSVTVGTSTFIITSGSPATVYFDANGNVQNGDTNAAGVLTVNSDGSYTFSVLGAFHQAAGNGENALDLPAMTITAVDGDGDPVSVSLALSVQDDVPVILGGDSLLVEEESVPGLAGNNEADGLSYTANGTIVDNAQWGADGFGSATSVTVGSSTFTIASGTPTTVYFDANGQPQGSSSNAAGVLTVNSDGSYTFSVLGAFHQTAGNGENNLALPAMTINAVDGDGDPVSISLALSVQDDVPVVNGLTDLIYANPNNPNPGGTGVYDYSIGSDSRTTYSESNSDFSAITLTGTVGNTAISSPSITWSSETADQAVFNIQFQYAANPFAPSVLSTAEGTLVFDKAEGTYTIQLDHPLDSFSVLTTSGTLSKESYNLDGSSDSQPEIVVSKLANDFYVRFTGDAEVGGHDPVKLSSGGDTNFVAGETISAAQSWVSISGTENGVASATIQKGDVLNMDFYTASPGNNANPGPGNARADGIYMVLDQLGSAEDFVVILKLVDPDNGNLTTRAIVVDHGDIWSTATSASNPYGITGGDGVVIIESNDYNGAGENYQIYGAQLLVSTGSLTGSAIDLNRDTGSTGNSTGTETLGGNTNDNDVIKFSDIGFVSTTTSTQDAHLSFQFSNVDADGDLTAMQTLNVTIEGSSTLVGTEANESLQGDSGNNTIIGGGGNDILTGGDGHDIFHFGADSFTAPGNDTITDFTIGNLVTNTNADILQVSDVLVAANMTYSGIPTDVAQAVNGGFLQVVQTGATTAQIVLDLDGTGGSTNSIPVVTLENLPVGTDYAGLLNTLLSNGELK